MRAARLTGAPASPHQGEARPLSGPDARAAAAREAAFSRRLLLIGDRLPALAAEAAGPRAARFRRLLEECRRSARAARLPAEHPAESVTWVGIGAMNHALLWLLSGEERWLAEARRWIGAALGWRQWGHAFLVDVDLSAAWLLWGLSLCYDWLGEALPAPERALLRGELARHAAIVHEFKLRTEGEGWSTNYWQNHNWIDMCGLAAAGYALLPELPEAAAWAGEARANFEVVYRELAEDGSDYEGAAYWRYGTPWLLAYAELERERGGRDFFASSAFLRNTFWYRLYQAAPNLEETVNFGDCHDTRSAHSLAVYWKLASEYRIPQAAWLAERAEAFLFREQHESGIRPGILPEAGLEYLWYDPSLRPEGPESLPLSRLFPDLGLLAARDSWREDATLLSVKCGPPGGARQWRRSWEIERERGWRTRGLSHQHPDNNAFVLISRGAYLASDEGYSRELFAADHSSVTVDGLGYSGEGRNNVWAEVPEDRVARLEACELDGPRFLFRGEASACYPPELRLLRCARTILGNGRGCFLVWDELRSELPHLYRWHLQTETAPLEGEGFLEWRNGPGLLRLHRLAPEDALVGLRETRVRAVMTPQEPTKLRESRLETLCAECAEPAESADFLHVLVAGSAFAPPRVGVEVLERGPGGIRFELRGEGWREEYLAGPGGLRALPGPPRGAAR